MLMDVWQIVQQKLMAGSAQEAQLQVLQFALRYVEMPSKRVEKIVMTEMQLI